MKIIKNMISNGVRCCHEHKDENTKESPLHYTVISLKTRCQNAVSLKVAIKSPYSGS